MAVNTYHKELAVGLLVVFNSLPATLQSMFEMENETTLALARALEGDLTDSANLYGQGALKESLNRVRDWKDRATWM